MMFWSVEYIGEHLLPGTIGHICVVLSFVAVLFAAFSFYRHSETGIDSWRSLGKVGYLVHSGSLLTLMGTLLYMMYHHMYEYQYVWEHVSDDLPMQYVLSAFWEGQEGSFILWMFWHMVLGGILVFSRSKWSSPVSAVLLAVQAVTASMILGLYLPFGDEPVKWGINPTLLLRETMDIPIFNNAQYLSMITGNGLNELLQNYWMTIHPPITFLGFASTTVPFAFAIAGWWKRDYKGWLQSVRNWALFSGFILGTGILMGGAWAYEALSFGGYWAWDPVENMSLVPWMVLVAGVHTNLIANSTGRSLKSSYIFYVLSFILIVYSTFLTRSGVLGDTSAHAFTEMGLEWQLVFFIGLFLVMAIVLYIVRRRSVPVIKKEESIYSKEFWMFIGAIVLFFGAVLIATSSSLPVYNKIREYFDPSFVGMVIEDPIAHYNKFQLWVALMIAFLSGFAVFTQWRKTSFSKGVVRDLMTSQGISLILAGVLTYLLSLWIDYFEYRYALLTFALSFGIISSLWYLITTVRRETKLAAASLSHFGFALMILGTITSSLNSRIISTNPFAMKGLVEDESLDEIVTLLKGKPMYTKDYWITYQKDSIVGRYRHYDILFEKVNKDTQVVESFVVHPNVHYNKKFTKVATVNPDTKHFWNRDIFTHIASLPLSQMDVELAREAEDSLKYKTYSASIGDTIRTDKLFAVVKDVTFSPDHEDIDPDSITLALGVTLEFGKPTSDERTDVVSAIVLKENNLMEYHGMDDPLGVKIKLGRQVFDDYFDADNELDYAIFKVKQGELFQFKDYTFRFEEAVSEIDMPSYTAKESDIPVQSNITMIHDGVEHKLAPVFFIRDNRPLNIKDYEINEGIHIRFTKIDPNTGEFYFAVAQDNRIIRDIPFEIAENVPRNDFIVLEAKEFPGINLFWLGSIVMLFGFLVVLWQRWRASNK